MDPTTTLFTFMLETHPTVQSVHLFGSWDNFSTAYLMERDIRRDRGQWRGCYSFKDIVCDDDNGACRKRNGGLKMGHKYYYYYELDGSQETHDTTLPSTTKCPYLPGQIVNTLDVPMEQVLRKRSASLTSLKITDYKTMNPLDKFITPRAPPPLPDSMRTRLGSSPLTSSSISLRSMSPAPAWRRLFSRRSSSRTGERDRQLNEEHWSMSSDVYVDDERSLLSSQGSRSRDISPESLQRFLADESAPSVPTDAVEERPTLSIPEDIVEENEDDLNFATSAVSENNPYATCLSPPPFKRSHSDSSMPTVTNGSQMTLTQYVHSTSDKVDAAHAPSPTRDLQSRPTLGLDMSESRFSMSSASSIVSQELRSPDDGPPSWYDSNDDDDELLSSNESETSYKSLCVLDSTSSSLDQPRAPIASYSLPQGPDHVSKQSLHDQRTVQTSIASPALIARSDHTLLASPSDHGIDDFVNEMNWMVDIIHGGRV
ncbi:hypothetical protein HYQ45_003505 [Verticillium longisporum]|nr:Pantothenate transporter liz1 [Verticillium dahliae VDG2]KAF3351877.1 hypothetical protein VdG1_04683 [Verticillium dahliae VDG1]KAG7139505.1 hypothetical protein HYQ45_003505 [Verticillium longisporum]PNH33623.1 hypothetical protein BJF96_g3166 [Verticillium dahliae]PNH49646.1 hypothetical protein VD0003_g7492 [Verticillium dahliae]